MLQSDVQSIDDGSDAPGMAIISLSSSDVSQSRGPGTGRRWCCHDHQQSANPALSISGGGIEPDHDRIHRVDVLCFFARGRYARRTGQAPSSPTKFDPQCLVSPTTTREAFIWYGHLALPDNLTLSKWSADRPADWHVHGTRPGNASHQSKQLFRQRLDIWTPGHSPEPASRKWYWEKPFYGLSLKKQSIPF